MEKPLLSVSIITYNQEDFIAECLESVVIQKTNFRFEVIIGEDCSTDGTRKIIEAYVAKYPDIIKPIYHSRNVGMMKNGFDYCLPACQGTYVACLTGDDYWTDPYKLQKQVDILEANPHYSMCFHNAKIVFDNPRVIPCLFNNPQQGDILTFEQLMAGWQIASASMVFRRELLVIPEWFTSIFNGDMGMQFLLMDKGPFKYIDNVMCVYRKHANGVTFSITPAENISKILRLLQLTNQHFDFKYAEEINKAERFYTKVLRFNKRKEKFPLYYTSKQFVKKSLLYIAHRM